MLKMHATGPCSFPLSLTLRTRAVSSVEKSSCQLFRGISPSIHRGMRRGCFESEKPRKVSGEHVLVMEWVDSLGPASDSNALKKAGLRPVDVMRTATEALELILRKFSSTHCFSFSDEF